MELEQATQMSHMVGSDASAGVQSILRCDTSEFFFFGGAHSRDGESHERRVVRKMKMRYR